MLLQILLQWPKVSLTIGTLLFAMLVLINKNKLIFIYVDRTRTITETYNNTRRIEAEQEGLALSQQSQTRGPRTSKNYGVS